MLRIVQSRSKNGKIETDVPFAEISKAVLSEKIVVLKNAIPVSDALLARDLIAEWGRKTPTLPHGVAMQKISPDLNYHRIDNDPTKSAAPHIHHHYTFNRLDLLVGNTRTILFNLFEKMRVFQNAVAGTDAEFSPTLESRKLRPQVLQYPQGGGFFCEHTHGFEPQRVGLVLAISKRNEDFSEGSFRVFKNNRWVNTASVHDAGDLIAFRFDALHDVTPCDASEELDWAKKTGRWTMVLPYY